MLHREILLLSIVTVVALNSQPSEAAVQEFSIPPNTGCACPGDILTYTCTAVGAGNSLWEGNVFECVGDSIALRHTQYDDGVGAFGDCNGGDITARSTGVENDCYTSQLTVRVSRSFNNKFVNCTHDSTMGIVNIGSSTLTVPEAPYRPPGNVRLTDVQKGLLKFSWNSFSANCKSATYVITSDCGSCPDVINSTVVNCTDLRLSTEARVCNFSVHVMLCGDVGDQSNPVAVTLKLPAAPSVQFIPRFADESRQLITLLAAVSQTVSYTIADCIPGSVLTYSIEITSNSAVLLNSSLTPMPCVDINCEEFVSVPFQCRSSTTVNVTLSAANRLGVGPTLDPVKIDCTNNFLEVKFDATDSTITCTFLDQPEGVINARSCRIQYGDCSSGLTEMYQANTTTNEISLNLRLSRSGQEYCYLITASNGSNIIMVEGKIKSDIRGGFPIAAPIVVVLILAVIVITIFFIAVFLKCLKKKDNQTNADKEYFGHIPLNQFDMNTVAAAADSVKVEELTVESKFNLKRIDLNDWTFLRLNVPRNFELKHFITEFVNLEFKRGFAFYEFLHKEDISDGKDIIFMNKDDEYFFPDVDKETLHEEKLIGEDVVPPNFKDYRIFIQSTGSGRRYIPQQSVVLYKNFLQVREHPLIRVDATKFALRKMKGVSNCTLEDFCKKCVPKPNLSAVYVEVDCVEDVDSILDVMLIDRATDGIFTGTFALNMAKKHFDQSSSNKIDHRHWRMYILQKFGDIVQMKEDTFVLYQIELSQEPETEQVLETRMAENELEGDIKANQRVQLSSEVYHQKMKPPLICVDSTAFVKTKIEKPCSLEEFREKHTLDVDVHNVFMESTRISQSCLQDTQILDVILEDQENENALYTCCAIWSIIDDYSKDKCRWRVYVLTKLRSTFVLRGGTSVLYRAKEKQLSGNCLIPIISKHFQVVTPEQSCTFDDFRKAQPQKCNIFLELDYIPKKQKIIDVVLMEKTSERLYSGLHARDLVKQHISGAQDLDQEVWEAAFVFCNFKSGLKLSDNAKVLCQNIDRFAQEFHILKVDDENVRLSDFIFQKCGEYEKGKAFYEYTQEDDLPYYKEVVLVSKNELENKHQLVLQSGTIFYGMFGASGLEIKPPNIHDKRCFVQSTSQGSRYLSEGMIILYKAETVTVDDHRC